MLMLKWMQVMMQVMLHLSTSNHFLLATKTLLTYEKRSKE
jgi:hypothetical protein